MKKLRVIPFSLIILLCGLYSSYAQQLVSTIQDHTDRNGKSSRLFNEAYFSFEVDTAFKLNSTGFYKMAIKGKPSNDHRINFILSKKSSDEYITTHIFLPPKTGRAPLFNEVVWFKPSVGEIRGIKCSIAIVVKAHGATTVYYADMVKETPAWVEEAWNLGAEKAKMDAAVTGKSVNEMKGTVAARNMRETDQQIGFARSPYEGDRLVSLLGKDPETSSEIDELQTKYLFDKNGLGVYVSKTITGMSFDASKGMKIDHVKVHVFSEEDSYHGKLPFGLKWSMDMDEVKKYFEGKAEIYGLDYNDNAIDLRLQFRTTFNGKKVKGLIVKNKNNSGQSLELWLES